jgi:putative FmdB family regulatory protein
MARYDFKCKNCGLYEEIVRSMNDDSIIKCSKCSAEMRQVFSAPPVHFKGSGFHSTDYKQTNYDQMTNDQKDTYDDMASDKINEDNEKNEKTMREVARDITR